MIQRTTTNGRPVAKKVKNSNPAPSKKQAFSRRETFVTSREMDFFSEKELVNQTGHDVEEWPFVIVKELVDNALDACEDLDIPPEITVTANESGISVSDNGPGLPESTLQSTLNFSVRVSSREGRRRRFVCVSQEAQSGVHRPACPETVVAHLRR
jgi:hypothetical protein